MGFKNQQGLWLSDKDAAGIPGVLLTRPEHKLTQSHQWDPDTYGKELDCLALEIVSWDCGLGPLPTDILWGLPDCEGVRLVLGTLLPRALIFLHQASHSNKSYADVLSLSKYLILLHSPSQLKKALYSFPVAYLSCQEYHSYALGPLWSKIKITWTQTLRYPTVDLITKIATNWLKNQGAAQCGYHEQMGDSHPGQNSPGTHNMSSCYSERRAI